MGIFDYDEKKVYEVAAKVDKILREHLAQEELEIVSVYL